MLRQNPELQHIKGRHYANNNQNWIVAKTMPVLHIIFLSFCIIPLLIFIAESPTACTFQSNFLPYKTLRAIIGRQENQAMITYWVLSVNQLLVRL